MNVHIAIFKWKKSITSTEINKSLEAVKDLENYLEGIQIYVGQNYSMWGKDYTDAVVVIGKNKEAIDSYRSHPLHEKVTKDIEEMELDGISIDFEDIVPTS